MKQYRILVRENGDNFARMCAYKTRQEATGFLSRIFNLDKDADPQKYKIQEEEIGEQTDFDKLIDQLMQRISPLGSFILQDKGESGTGTECVTLLHDMDIWAGTILRIIVDTLGDKATFSICKSSVTGRVVMYIWG